MQHGADGRSWLYRLGPSAVAAFWFLGFALLWWFDRPLYAAVMGQYIWNNAETWAASANFPFFDLGAVLQAAACWRQGVDVFAPNACMQGGIFNYTPLLLRIGLLGIGPGAQLTGGVLLGLLFIAASAFLPPVRKCGEFLLRSAVLCSCAVVHGLVAANIDLAVFVLVVAGVALQRAGFAGRVLGYALFLFGGALKFYPAVLLALTLRENRLRLACIGAVLTLGAGIVAFHYAQALSGIFVNLPLGLPFRGSFGAVNLPFGLALLAFMDQPSVLPGGEAFHAALHHPGLPLYVVLGSRVLVLAALATGLRLASLYAAPLARLDERRRLFLVAGAVLLAFCFYIAPNYEYRGVYLLLTLPGLHGMARAGSKPARLILALILPLLCERILWTVFGAIGALLPGHALASWLGILLWLLREAGWWFIMVSFTAIGFAFMRAAFAHLQGGGEMLPIHHGIRGDSRAGAMAGEAREVKS